MLCRSEPILNFKPVVIWTQFCQSGMVPFQHYFQVSGDATSNDFSCQNENFSYIHWCLTLYPFVDWVGRSFKLKQHQGLQTCFATRLFKQKLCTYKKFSFPEKINISRKKSAIRGKIPNSENPFWERRGKDKAEI